VQVLISVFDVPAHLALILSLAASTAANDLASAPPTTAAAPVTHEAPLMLEPLEGPFKFSESSWLRALKEGAFESAVIDYSGRIFKTSGGRYYVPAADERHQVLDKRRDGALAARVARAFAESNRQALRTALRRRPTAGELYIAHVFGPEAAARFIRRVAERPGEAATKFMPELARSAPGVLKVHGVPLTLANVYKRLTDAVRRAAPAVGSVAKEPAEQKRALLYFKPTVAEPLHRAGFPRGGGARAVAWRTKVSADEAAVPAQ